MLDPLELNYLAIGKKTIISPSPTFSYPDSYLSGEAVPSIAVYPVKNTQRICAQLAVFTVQGNSREALDKEFGGRLVQNGWLEAIAITNEVRQDALRFIKQNGISHFSLFPDLDGLAAYLNNTLTQSQSTMTFPNPSGSD
ncbi:hypothetical protein SDC9_145297 [bioreactor metagenome]|uniref:Uncharacterized protein n=1 Tax=bioreactor metagenome TaxID=1076179 RepID=A0A645E938_9ZZZZ